LTTFDDYGGSGDDGNGGGGLTVVTVALINRKTGSIEKGRDPNDGIIIIQCWRLTDIK